MNSELRFCLDPSQSPTHYNLHRYLQERGWQSCSSSDQANFSDANLQFDTKAAESLEFKHLLAKLVAQYCPDLMPITYCINDENWPLILNKIANKYYLFNGQFANQIEGLVWILKPALLNNGKEIKIFQKLSELEQHYLSSKRLGGEHVLQRYLSNPHLLRDERKYSIRMFVVLSNYAGAYLYPQGYFNVAMHRFTPQDFSDLRPHLTNEHLEEDESNVIQIPSQRFESFASLYPQIKAQISAVIKGLEQLHPLAFVCDKRRHLAIYGFDFIVDNQGHLWLLEANHGPCFPISDEHPLQSHLYYDFWQHFMTSFVEPIGLEKPCNQIRYYLFEPLEI
jgi:hypothetical protein